MPRPFRGVRHDPLLGPVDRFLGGPDDLDHAMEETRRREQALELIEGLPPEERPARAAELLEGLPPEERAVLLAELAGDPVLAETVVIDAAGEPAEREPWLVAEIARQVDLGPLLAPREGGLAVYYAALTTVRRLATTPRPGESALLTVPGLDRLAAALADGVAADRPRIQSALATVAVAREMSAGGPVLARRLGAFDALLAGPLVPAERFGWLRPQLALHRERLARAVAAHEAAADASERLGALAREGDRVTELLGALRSGNDLEQVQAAAALGWLGARGAVELLERRVAKPSPPAVRAAAFEALVRIDPASWARPEPLDDLLAGADPDDRARAVATLAAVPVGPDQAWVERVLRKALGGPPPVIEAALSVIAVRGGSEELRPAVEALVGRPDLDPVVVLAAVESPERVREWLERDVLEPLAGEAEEGDAQQVDPIVEQVLPTIDAAARVVYR